MTDENIVPGKTIVEVDEDFITGNLTINIPQGIGVYIGTEKSRVPIKKILISEILIYEGKYHNKCLVLDKKEL